MRIPHSILVHDLLVTIIELNGTSLSKIIRCLEHASTLILICFEYDLGMFEGLIQVRTGRQAQSSLIVVRFRMT